MRDLPARARRAYVECLGCAANRADGAGVERALASAGWALVSSPEDARLVVLMSCAFTAAMESRSRTRIEELSTLLPAGGRLMIGGCLAAIARAPFELPEATVVFSPADMSAFTAEIDRMAHDEPVAWDPAGNGRGGVQLVRVATGCGSRCAFCAIPKAAGATRSRSPAAVVAEINELGERGFGSFQLTSEDFSSYGRDLGTSFVELVREVLASTRAKRVILDTLNPRWLHRYLESFLDLVADPRIDDRLYVPIQSGSDRMLMRMARGYRRPQVLELLEALSAHPRGLRVSTDFLVGFPGETAEDFDDTRRLLHQHDFDFVEVFCYSEREGTPAAHFPDPVPCEVRHQRVRTLLADLIGRDLDRRGFDGDVDLVEWLTATATKLPINTNIRL